MGAGAARAPAMTVRRARTPARAWTRRSAPATTRCDSGATRLPNARAAPPYLYLTNRQAAELARKPPTSLADLREVRGIGESRVEALGAELLAQFEAMAGEGAVEPEAPAGQEAPADAQ